MKPKLTWLLAPISVGAFVATWGGWAKLASMTGYAEVQMLPGQPWSTFNIGIVLPMTVEPFGMLAAAIAFNPKVKSWARWIAGVMALGTLFAAAFCQATVHHLTVTGQTTAPDYVVAVTSVLPVIVLGLGAALGVLNGVRTETDGTSHGTPGTSFMGRIGKALGDAAASQAERLAAVSQASRDAIPEMSRDEAPVPVPVPKPVSQALVPVVGKLTRDDVPAAQAAFKELPVREQERLVGEAKAGPDHPSYEKLGRRFGISKSEAGRLGKAYADRLKQDPVIVRDGTAGDGWKHPWEEKLDAERAADGVKVNGKVPDLKGVSA